MRLGHIQATSLIRYCGVFLLAWVALGVKQTAAQSMPTSLSNETFRAGDAMVVEAIMDSARFLNGGYPIDSTGFVEIPVVGRIQVSGRSRNEVEEYLGQKLANYLRDTHIKAQPAIRLTMLGYWTHPGQYYVPANATVWEAARMAGGIAGERTLDEIRVQRGERSISSIHFLNEYSQGSSLGAAGIHSGDLFVIPVPRDNTGAWYWFRETLTVTAQIATIAGTVLTTYITYLYLQDRRSGNNQTTTNNTPVVPATQ